MSINYESFLSAAAIKMRGSAIRKMSGIAAQARDVVSFAPGFPAPETFPWAEFQEIARELLSGRDGSVLQYGATRGFKPLLESVHAIMAARGVTTTMERLMLTTGSQQGLDLVARVLLDPHDVILVELPTYTGAIMAFRNAQASLVGVRQEADGIELDDLDDTYLGLQREGRRVRVLYLVPNFQNPTGLLIGLDKRRALLEWAERRDVLIVEDDPYFGRRCPADSRRRPHRPRRLHEQLLEDARAWLSRRLDRGARASRREVRAGEAGGGLVRGHARSADRSRSVRPRDSGSAGADASRTLSAQARRHGRRIAP
jgi:DNA-binding transcriptional MocR family regulator